METLEIKHLAAYLPQILDDIKMGYLDDIVLRSSKATFQVSNLHGSDFFTCSLDGQMTDIIDKSDVIEQHEVFTKYSNFHESLIIGEEYNVFYMSMHGLITAENRISNPPKKVIYLSYMKDLVDGGHLKLYR